MSQPPHVIRRQLVELHLPAGTDSRAVQERVSCLCRETLTALLDEHLSRHAGQEDVQLTRLELDLGTIALAELEQVLPQRLAHELARVLPPAVLAAAGPAAEQRKASAGSSPPGKLAGEAGHHPAHGAQQGGSPPGKLVGKDTDLIAYFLRSGLLPWWATPVSAQRLADAFTRAQLQDAGALRQLLAELLDEPVAAARLFYSCQDALLEQLLGLWLPAAPQRTQLLLLQAALLGPQGTARNATAGRMAWWYGLYKTAATEGVGTGQYDTAAIRQMLTRFMAAKEAGSRAAPLATQGTLELLAEVFSLKKAVPTPARPTIAASQAVGTAAASCFK
jgi:hypothetical protein